MFHDSDGSQSSIKFSSSALVQSESDEDFRKTRDSRYVFYCKSSLPKEILSVLKGIAVKKDALCCVSAQGIQFTVEQAKSFGAYAYLQKSLFHSFEFDGAYVNQLNMNEENESDDAVLRFVINLHFLIECFSIVSPSCTTGEGAGDDIPDGSDDIDGKSRAPLICIGLDKELARLTVSMKDNNTDTECSIVTYDVEGFCDLAGMFRSSPIANKVILKSKPFRDSLLEFEKSVQVLVLHLSPNEPNFRLEASNISGQVEQEFPSSSNILESVNCDAEQTIGYNFSAILAMMKALSVSTKINLRTNTDGILSVQCMVPITSTENCFVEFVALPMVDALD